MAKFKVGDRVRGTKESDRHYNTTNSSYTGFVTELCSDDRFVIDGTFTLNSEYFELVSTSNKTNMNITEKFALAFKSEPEKSFRKAGITNGDDFLTEDGQKIFLSFLLKKYGNEFKAEVVDKLVEEKE